MTRIRFGLLVCLVALAGAVASAGGWAVVTIQQLPDYAVVGVPMRLDLAVRQHGFHLGQGFAVAVRASLGKEQIWARVQPLQEVGYYRADLTLPRVGAWRLNVGSGFADNTAVSMPAYASGSAPAEVTLGERGHRLFSAKGCATCHRHDSAAASASVQSGPALTSKRYPLEMLTAFLAAPPPCAGVVGKPCMPVLGITADEARALGAFLNQGPTIRVVASR
jgi:mono/diheme cytochrome c family protein